MIEMKKNYLEDLLGDNMSYDMRLRVMEIGRVLEKYKDFKPVITPLFGMVGFTIQYRVDDRYTTYQLTGIESTSSKWQDRLTWGRIEHPFVSPQVSTADQNIKDISYIDTIFEWLINETSIPGKIPVFATSSDGLCRFTPEDATFLLNLCPDEVLAERLIKLFRDNPDTLSKYFR